MADINFAGLATGLDTSAIINKLVEVERARIPVLETQKSNFNRQISILSDIISKLGTLKTDSLARDELKEVSAYKATAEDTTVFTATVSGSAQPAQYGIKVTGLAQNDRYKSKTFTSNAATGTGTLNITVGSDAAVGVAYTSGETLDDIAARINASGARVSAVVLKDGTGNFFLNIYGRSSGTNNAITFSVSGGGSNSDFSYDSAPNKIQAAADATMVIDGVNITRNDNVISDAIDGVTLTLLTVNNSSKKLTVDRDLTTEKANLKQLVTDYNAVASALTSQLSFVKGGTAKGRDTLFADSTLRSLQEQMAKKMAQTYDTISPRDIGFNLSSTGQLTFDEAMYDKVVTADHKKVEKLMTGSTGLAKALQTMVDDFTKPGSSGTSDGYLLVRKSGIAKRVADLDASILAIDQRATRLGDRLRQTFARLEATISTLKSQGDQMLAALSRL
jgi:flagellar hook-associated protein 2